MKRCSSPDETRERIIRAAGEVFGQHGFHGTTIRQITDRAGVNVAAVNYHFRDKNELYIRVLREAKCFIRDVAGEAEGTPEVKLRAFIASLVRRLLAPDRPLWHVQVITQEMMHPTPAIDILVRELNEPLFNQVRALVRAVAGTDIPANTLDMLAAGVLGECLFYVRSRPMIDRIAPNLMRGEDYIERIAGHIADFTLAALRQQYPQPTSNKRRPPAAPSLS